MSQWTAEQLNNIGKEEEVQIASIRGEGMLRKPVTTWIVRHDAIQPLSEKSDGG